MNDGITTNTDLQVFIEMNPEMEYIARPMFSD